MLPDELCERKYLFCYCIISIGMDKSSVHNSLSSNAAAQGIVFKPALRREELERDSLKHIRKNVVSRTTALFEENLQITPKSGLKPEDKTSNPAYPYKPRPESKVLSEDTPSYPYRPRPLTETSKPEKMYENVHRASEPSSAPQGDKRLSKLIEDRSRHLRQGKPQWRGQLSALIIGH